MKIYSFTVRDTEQEKKLSVKRSLKKKKACCEQAKPPLVDHLEKVHRKAVGDWSKASETQPNGKIRKQHAF